MVGLIIYVCCVAALCIGAIWRPPIALAALLSLHALKQWGMAKVGFVGGDLLFTNYVVGGVVALALVSSFLKGQLRSAYAGDLTLFVLLLYGYAIVAVLWSPAPDHAVDELVTNLPYVLLTVLVVPMLIRQFKSAHTALQAFLVIGVPLLAAFVFLATWEYRAIASDFGGESIRLPLALAQFAGALLIVAGLTAQNSILRYAALVGIAALAVTIAIRTGSRGQFIAMVISAGLFYPISLGYRGSMRALATLALCGGLAGWAFSLYADTGSDVAAIDERWSSGDIEADYQGRLEHSGDLLDAWMSDPWSVVFGMGTAASFSPTLGGGYAHILPIDVLTELGLIGFSLLAVLLWRCLRTVAAAIKTVNRGDSHAVRNAAIAAMVALFFMDLMLSFKQGTLLRNSYLFMFPVLLQAILATESVLRAYVERQEAIKAETIPTAKPMMQY